MRDKFVCSISDLSTPLSQTKKFWSGGYDRCKESSGAIKKYNTCSPRTVKGAAPSRPQLCWLRSVELDCWFAWRLKSTASRQLCRLIARRTISSGTPYMSVDSSTPSWRLPCPRVIFLRSQQRLQFSQGSRPSCALLAGPPPCQYRCNIGSWHDQFELVQR